MRKKMILVAVVVVSLGTVVLPLSAGEIDPETASLLHAIITGYRDNRAKTTDFMMNGAVEKIEADHEHGGSYKSTLQFKYYELGDKARSREQYTPDSMVDEDLKGSVNTWITDSVRAMSYRTNSDGFGIFIQDAKNSGLAKYPRLLDTPRITRAFADYTEEIEKNFGRWRPDAENYLVEAVTLEGRDLLKVTYNSTRGGDFREEFIVDPAKGFELVRFGWNSHSRDGTFLGKMNVEYTVEEVAPGVWRPVGCVFTETNEKTNDVYHITITPESFAANTGEVSESLFTLEALGAPDGVRVTDATFTPSIEYVMKDGVLQQTDLDRVADAVLDSALSDLEPRAAVAAPAAGALTSEDVADAGTDAVGQKHRWWREVFPWGVSVAVVSFVIAWIIQKRRRRR